MIIDIQLNQGSDSFSVNAGDVSGVLHLVASSTGLLAGVWGGDIEYFTTGEELQDITAYIKSFK